jgi:hypothetical protein
VNENKKKYQCIVCGNMYTDKGNLSRHKKTHKNDNGGTLIAEE